MKGDACDIAGGAVVTTRPLVKEEEALRMLQEHLLGAAEATVEVTSERVRNRMLELLTSQAAEAAARDNEANSGNTTWTEGRNSTIEHTEASAEVDCATLIAQVQERISIATDTVAHPGELLMVAPGISPMGQAHPAWTIKSIAAAWDAGGDGKTSPAIGRRSSEAGKLLPHPAEY